MKKTNVEPHAGPSEASPGDLADEISATAKRASDEVRQSAPRRMEAPKSGRRDAALGRIAMVLIGAAILMTIFNVSRNVATEPSLSPSEERAAAESLMAAQVAWVEAYKQENGSLPADLGETALPESERVWEFTAQGDSNFTLTVAGQEDSYEFRSDESSLEELTR